MISNPGMKNNIYLIFENDNLMTNFILLFVQFYAFPEFYAIESSHLVAYYIAYYYTTTLLQLENIILLNTNMLYK